MSFLRVLFFTLISYYLLLHVGFCKVYQKCLVALKSLLHAYSVPFEKKISEANKNFDHRMALLINFTIWFAFYSVGCWNRLIDGNGPNLRLNCAIGDFMSRKRTQQVFELHLIEIYWKISELNFFILSTILSLFTSKRAKERNLSKTQMGSRGCKYILVQLTVALSEMKLSIIHCNNGSGKNWKCLRWPHVNGFEKLL